MIAVSIVGLLVFGYFLFLFLFFIVALFLLIKAIYDRKGDEENEKYKKIMK